MVTRREQLHQKLLQICNGRRVVDNNEFREHNINNSIKKHFKAYVSLIMIKSDITNKYYWLVDGSNEQGTIASGRTRQFADLSNSINNLLDCLVNRENLEGFDT